MDEALPNVVKKGRGVAGNATGRFEAHTRILVDDGWDLDDDDLPKLRTEVTVELVKSAMSRNASPDLPFDRSLNPYRGCEHGCVYCYARPSHAYMNLSPGLDFETKLFAKKGMAAALEKELRKPGYTVAPVMIGANTDPYQPIEDEYRNTRALLEVLRDYNHPVAIITKSNRILRDVDLLADMARDGLASVAISVTTLDKKLARTMEPRAASPPKRLQAIKDLSDAGIPVCVMAAPMIPALNDFELESILAAGATAGATRASYIVVRLPLELEDLFSDWLETYEPHKKSRILSLIRQTREGALNSSSFGSRFTGLGPHAQLLRKRFNLACKKLNIDTASRERFTLNCDIFTCPPRAGDQLGLF